MPGSNQRVAEKLERIVSFRLSPEEYDRVLQACATAKVRSVSELTRKALTEWMEHAQENNLDGLRQRIEQLERRVAELAAQVNLLAQGMSASMKGEA